VLLNAAVSAGFSYAFTRVTPDSAAHAEQLKNIPRHLLRPHVTLNLPYGTSLHARYVRAAGAFADDTNRVPLGDRSTIDMRVSKRISRATATLDLINLAGDHYEEVGYVLADFRGGVVPYLYPAPGSAFRAGLTLTF